MKKTYWLFFVLVSVSLVLFMGCPADDPDPGPNTTEVEEEVVLAKHDDTIKINIHPTSPQRVVQTLWQEPWPDPRVQMGYQLDDENGTPFFDHYVMLYGFRLKITDCARDSTQLYCNKTGPHIHIDTYANTGKYITNYETHFKPLHERGMKVLFSIVPSGFVAV
ncbi:hypothetical protein AGMMS50267_12090 [Spirochaetia bacterium]|nr:hypothetical protein AGMMS50267_12090 [Spirochaetia bacterium]